MNRLIPILIIGAMATMFSRAWTKVIDIHILSERESQELERGRDDSQRKKDLSTLDDDTKSHEERQSAWERLCEYNHIQ